ncbi:COMM domain-containing protein, putative [Entamoeba dispar SAW760]|uniref:COMM domain-containing protein 3 n=2 Tax=Entamoeba dispar (strain ATCC PRA-260 / SAW760) TaxID=370354 RepID=B0EBU1_ENTDS|nr:COMM domain-containing protein, putative [Entamoeba dispar SAW760]XP_001741563.1 COMM domain-containing protein, putative [Entamoeba dispar SAW760]EDR21990.1 COMM domain-containing protein, putative [Entamoeba dispar SAW760]EDR28002.1 COMM domain-containing protein, putative [Entamoeba dispar SAW760]|eukprot:EDR21990.1 COMM domain-containing protein, putative [Entamoeba dispar SAW760]
MEIPEGVCKELNQELSVLSEEQLKTQCENIVQEICNGDEMGVRSDKLYDCVCLVFLEGAKNDIGKEQYIEVLEANEIGNKQKRSVLAEVYDLHKEMVRNILKETTTTLTKIIGVSWKLDFFVRPEHKEISPVFLVTLKTKVKDNEGKVDFVCTHEEMEDLITKLKDAQQQIERSASHV